MHKSVSSLLRPTKIVLYFWDVHIFDIVFLPTSLIINRINCILTGFYNTTLKYSYEIHKTNTIFCTVKQNKNLD